MTDGRDDGSAAPPGVATPGEAAADDPTALARELARDWVTLWHSELAALASDREAQETWRALLALWAGAFGAWLETGQRAGADGAPRPARAPAPAGPSAAAAASDARDAQIEELASRLAELEQRLAGVEPRRPGGGRRRR